MIEAIFQYWQTGGVLMAVLALLGLGIWYHYFSLRDEAVEVAGTSGSFEDDLARRLAQGTIEDNLRCYEAGDDALSRAVAHTLRAVRKADQPSGDAFDGFQDAFLARCTRECLILSAYTGAAPLVGLLGTVLGMVTTFEAVSADAGNTAVQVSAGISQALVTTQCGLVVAIPGMFGLAHVRRLTRQACVRFGACRTHLVYRLEASDTVKDPT